MQKTSKARQDMKVVCPKCEAHAPVTIDVLSSKGGWMRCPGCWTIFDAYLSLSPVHSTDEQPDKPTSEPTLNVSKEEAEAETSGASAAVVRRTPRVVAMASGSVHGIEPNGSGQTYGERAQSQVAAGDRVDVPGLAPDRIASRLRAPLQVPGVLHGVGASGPQDGGDHHGDPVPHEAVEEKLTHTSPVLAEQGRAGEEASLHAKRVDGVGAEALSWGVASIEDLEAPTQVGLSGHGLEHYVVADQVQESMDKVVEREVSTSVRARSVDASDKVPHAEVWVEVPKADVPKASQEDQLVLPPTSSMEGSAATMLKAERLEAGSPRAGDAPVTLKEWDENGKEEMTLSALPADVFAVKPSRWSLSFARAGRSATTAASRAKDGFDLMFAGADPEPQTALERARLRAKTKEDIEAQRLVRAREKSERFTNIAGSIASGVLALTLAFQVAYQERFEIYSRVPTSRRLLDAACRALRCDVGYALEANDLALASADVRLDEGGHLVFSGSLKNTSAYDSKAPRLWLSIEGPDGAVMSARVFEPDEWLGAHFVKGSSEREARMVLSALANPPSGYKAELVFDAPSVP